MTFPETILPQVTEIWVDGAWVDITSRVYSRDLVTIKRGRANEATSFEPSNMQLTVNNRDGYLSPRNPRSPYYGKIGRNTVIRHSVIGDGYALVDAATGGTPVGGASVSTPDNVALDFAGGVDVDVRVDVDLTTWREYTEFISKGTITGNQRGWVFALSNTGYLSWWRSSTGSNLIGVYSRVPVPVTSGRLAIRASIDVDNGVGGYTITFYTAPTSAGPWTLMGAPIVQTTTGAMVFFNNTSPAYLVDNPGENVAGSVIRGRFYSAQVYANGVLVANPDFAGVANGAASFVDSTGKTWTPNGAVKISTRDVRFAGEIPSWPQKWDTTGTDVYVELGAAGIFQRLGQGSAALESALKRGISSLSSLKGYWAMEDGDGATRLASSVPNGVPMVPIGVLPEFSADSGFKASLPLPFANGSVLSGTLRPYSSTGAIQVRFLMHIPDTGTANGAVICRIFCGGTAPRWDLIYETGGLLKLQPYDSSDAAIGAAGPISFDRDGAYGRISVELNNSGSAVAWRITVLDLGQESGGTFSATVSSRQIGSCSRVVLNANKKLEDVALGHLTVESVITSLYDLRSELNAYVGETAGRRIQRLCREQGVTIQGDGNLDDTELMGPQLPQTLFTLLAECAEADMGILYEPRDQLAVGYRPRSASYLQPATAALSYSGHQLMGLEPVEDDQLLRNDITASRPEGSSYRAVQESGTLSILDPPLGVGVYPEAVEPNVALDEQLGDQAGWRLRIGTLDEPRFPSLPLNLASAALVNDAATLRTVKACDVGHRVVVSGLPIWMAPENISQVIQGTEERLAQYTWEMTWNLSPSAPFDSVGVYGPGATGQFVARYSSDGSTLSSAINTTATSLSIATPTGPLWTHIDGDYDINIGGEQMTVTNVTGSSSPQTFTVVRSVNGIVKSHGAGSVMGLFTPAYYAL